MSTARGRSPPKSRSMAGDDDNNNDKNNNININDAVLSSRQLEAFGRTVHATASQLIAPLSGNEAMTQHYQNALGEMHREMRRPLIQRSVWSLAKTNPRELVRSTLNTAEIQHRALTHLPDELLRHVPVSTSSYSLFQGFRASLPEDDNAAAAAAAATKKKKKKHSRHNSKGQKLLDASHPALPDATAGHVGFGQLKHKKHTLDHRLEMMGVRKNMCVSEIREIDTKIANLNTMRRIVLERLAALESEEADLEHDLLDVSNQLEDLQEELEDAAALAPKSPTVASTSRPTTADNGDDGDDDDMPAHDSPGFMSESIYEKLPDIGKALPSPTGTVKKRKSRPNRRISMPVLHEHLDQGSRIREFQAHTDMITALDFDQPFGTLVTSAMDDTVRVWDLNAGRCLGMLEGHLSSVRCLQVSGDLVATGSMDASIRLWDLSLAEYAPPPSSSSTITRRQPADSDDHFEDEDAGLMFSTPGADAMPAPPPAPTTSMADCEVFALQAHVAEVTAIHMHNNTLVSGSADKTLRQWDLEKGRCVQTLDVLWAAAQASTLNPTFATGAGPGAASPPPQDSSWFRPMAGRVLNPEADFVGAVQVFDAALACGTADGMVRLWDLRSGMVSRSLVGHTGPVTALQFDDVHLVTGSADRSIRIWDLRTGTLYDAFAYDMPIQSMQFDARRIVSAIGDPVIKVYDKADGRHWDCGPGASLPLDDADLGIDGTVGGKAPAAVERVRIKDGYLVEGRRDGVVGVWSC